MAGEYAKDDMNGAASMRFCDEAGFWSSRGSFDEHTSLRVLAIDCFVSGAGRLETQGLPFEETPIDILSGEQFKPGYDAVNPSMWCRLSFMTANRCSSRWRSSNTSTI